ncbi:zinc metalloprotease [Yersinia aldovae]|uniref:hypothetical protein n=1 Tax=Yersinia aldovae TaxID=29483 RepID=UPI0011A2577F|nr:hypothetical protein [Yersinia aldovae]
MNINNPNPDNHTHPLANQLVRNRLGQWPHTPGTETTLTVKFLSAGKDPMNIWPEVENPGPFTSEEIRLTKAALKTIEETINLRFIFVEEGPAQITFGQFQQLTKKQTRFSSLSGYADLYSANPSLHGSDYKNDGTTINSGDFSGPIPVWIRSSAALGIENFQKNIAHELGHALGLAHLPPSQTNIDGSIMGGTMLREGAFNQPNNGFGDADLLALREIYSADQNKPVDLYHRGAVYYDESYGHASVTPAGSAQFGTKNVNKENQVIRLRKGITPNNLRVELQTSTQAIKLIFTDNPDASLIINPLSEPLIPNGDMDSRFKRIRLANKQTLLIDDQLYHTLKTGRQPQWQEAPSLAKQTQLQPDSHAGLSGYEFSLTDNQKISVINNFSFKNDRLALPELKGRKLHILEKGNKHPLSLRNENHVIFRQRELISLNTEYNLSKMEFVLINFDNKGSPSKVFINVDLGGEFPGELYMRLLRQGHFFLKREELQEIYAGLGDLNMEIQEPVTQLVILLPSDDIQALSTAISSFPPPQSEAQSLLTDQLVALTSNRYQTTFPDTQPR